jgi:hypothetical protein
MEQNLDPFPDGAFLVHYVCMSVCVCVYACLCVHMEVSGSVHLHCNIQTILFKKGLQRIMDS